MTEEGFTPSSSIQNSGFKHLWVSMLPSVQGLLAGTAGLIGGFYSCAHTMNPTLQSSLSALPHWQTTAPPLSTDILCRARCRLTCIEYGRTIKNWGNSSPDKKSSTCSNVYRITKNTFKLFILNWERCTLQVVLQSVIFVWHQILLSTGSCWQIHPHVIMSTHTTLVS